MSERGTWAFVVSCVTLVLVVLITALTTYYHEQDMVIERMVAGGASPLEAVCSMTDVYGNDPVCIALAVKGSKGE